MAKIPTEDGDIPNAGQREFWNTGQMERWLAQQPTLDRLFEGITAHLLDTLAPSPANMRSTSAVPPATPHGSSPSGSHPAEPSSASIFRRVLSRQGVTRSARTRSTTPPSSSRTRSRMLLTRGGSMSSSRASA